MTPSRKGSLARASILTLILIASGAFYIVSFVATSESSAPEVLNGILRPRIGYPAFITQNGTFEAKAVLLPDAEVWRASLSNELGKYELKVESLVKNRTDNTVTLKVKAQDIPPGLYSLELSALATGGAVASQFQEPNSVSVRRSFELPFRVMWITDTHIDDTPAQSLNFRRIVRLANFLRPDFILHTGDVINFARESFFPLANLLMQDLEVPIVLAPGNHDHATEGEFFVKYLAPWYGSLDVGPVHIVTLDSGPGSIVGELPEPELAWLRSDLSANARSKFKILMWHHPMFDVDNPRNETVRPVYGIAKQYGVNLILNGHMHADIIFRGPVLTLINPNAYEGGRPYTGFRMLTITESGIDHSYAGGEQSIPLYEFDINYSQPNDGKSFGIVVQLANRWKMTVNGLLRLRVAYGDFLKVDGAAVSSITNRTDYTIISTAVTLGQGEANKIVAYTKMDTEPPVIELETGPKIVEGPTAVIVEFRWKIFDSVLGVQKAEMHYSTDNKTWTNAPLIQVEPRAFWARAQFDKSTAKVTYYARAWDMEERVATSPYLSIAVREQPSETVIQPPPLSSISVILVSVAIAAIVTGAAYARRRKRAIRATVSESWGSEEIG